jgi:type I restriction enzyme S subunit
MEVREPSIRYLAAVQRTELGEFPADWTVVPIGKFEPFITSGSRGWAAFYTDIGSTFLRITNLSRSSIYPSLQDLRYVAIPINSSEGIRTALKIDDVLISITADIGIVGLITQAVELPAYINQHIALVRFNTEAVNSRYISYFLAGAAAQRRIKSMTDAGAKAGMSLAGVRDVLAALPPSIDEQAAIANALAESDALIDALDGLLTKKRQIKQGTMQELLSGRRRLPGFDGKWDVIELRQLGEFVRGVAYNPTQDLSEGDTKETVRLLRSNNVQAGEIVRVGLQFVNRRRVRCDQYLQSNDLLLCMANGSRDLVGKTARYISLDEQPYTFGAFMGCYRPNSVAIDPRFISFHFQTHDFRQHVDLLLAGSSINNLRPEGVLSFTFRKPHDPNEQIAIAQVLSDMEADITCLESRLTQARDLKQAMAQALLTGRIRLVEPKV